MSDGGQPSNPFAVEPLMDLNEDPAPLRRRDPPRRFQPKIKGKIKPDPTADERQLATVPQSSTPSATTSAGTTALEAAAAAPMEVDVPDSAEDEDLVVREIDVFCTRLEDDAQLYVMQYPLRPFWRPYELDKQCELVKANPKHSEVQLVLHMDVDSENYDVDAPESTRIKTQILSSSRATSQVQLATGILIKNQLHLNPVHEVLQFRPSIKHINSCGEEKAEHDTQEADSKYDKAWLQLAYNRVGSKPSGEYQQKMITVADCNINSSIPMNPSEYVNAFCPGTSTIKMKPKVPSSSFLPSLPLEERLKEWLCKGRHVNRFAALMHLDPTVSKEDLLMLLERHAYLVHGSWVTKSSLICEGHEAQLRDYILFLFSESNSAVIKVNKLKDLRVSDGGLRHLLGPLAYKRPLLGDWKFRECDLSFIKQHCKLVEKHKAVLSSRGGSLEGYLSRGGRIQPISTNSSLLSKMADKKQKVDTGSNRVNGGSGSLIATSMSNECRETLKKALLHIFRDGDARSINSIRQELRDLALSKSSRPKEDSRTKALVNAITVAASGTSSDLLSVLKEVTIEIDNLYVLRSGESQALDPLRSVVLELFSEKGSNAKLKKQDIVEAAKASLKRDITASEYTKVVKELCVYMNGSWVLRGAGNPK